MLQREINSLGKALDIPEVGVPRPRGQRWCGYENKRSVKGLEIS